LARRIARESSLDVNIAGRFTEGIRQLPQVVICHLMAAVVISTLRVVAADLGE
jgi:hypothetical protein